jgi:hypothetical protein
MYRILIFLEKFDLDREKSKLSNFLKALFIIIFIPIFLILEIICYYHFWKKIALYELLTTDEVVNFLDNNEFALVGRNKLIKKDLLSNHQDYIFNDIDESKHKIKFDFIKIFTELIEKNISLNIEDLMTVIVNIKTENKIIEKERYRVKIFSIIIQYQRTFFLKLKLIFMLYWLLIFSCSIIAIKILL